ncbi:MAG: response regulator [Erythrobacter sp.]
MSDTILIVEDEMLVALEMQSILEERGYQVLGIAADLEGAMTYAERGVGLALIDLNLRDGLTGPEIGARLANQFQTAVLFITANPRLLGDGVAGTIGVLTKPTDEASLLSAVRFVMARRHGEDVAAPSFIRCFR